MFVFVVFQCLFVQLLPLLFAFTISHDCIFLRNEEADVLKEEDWGRTFIANYEVIIHISSIGIEITGTCVIQIMGKLSAIIMIDYR